MSWLLIAVVFLLGPMKVSAQPAWTASEWSVDYSVLEDGELRVQQHIILNDQENIEENRVLQLPLLRPFQVGYGPASINYVRISDAAGQVLPPDKYSIESSFDRLIVVIDIAPADRTEWLVDYMIGGAVMTDNNLDQLELVVLPVATAVHINIMDVTFSLPETVKSEDIVAALSYGTQSDRVVISPNKLEATKIQFALKNIGGEKGVWANLTWPVGAVAATPSTTSFQIWQKLRPYYYGTPIIFAIYLIYTFLRYGRDPKVKDLGGLHNRPPEGLSPAHLGTLIHERVRITFLIAMVVDLAQRGYIRIIEEERRSALSKKDYTFVKQREFIDDASLAAVEMFFLKSLFSVGILPGSGRRTDRVKASTLKNHFATRIRKMRVMIMNDLIVERYFREHSESVRQRYIIIATAIALLALPISLFAGIIYHNVYAGIPIMIIAGLFFFFSPLMPQKTKKGALVHEWAEQFKRYLQHADRHSPDGLSADIFSRYLPYAMIFGVERAWSSVFEKRLNKPPQWFVPSGSFVTFSATALSHSLRSSFAHAASQNLLAAPGQGSHLGKNTE